MIYDLKPQNNQKSFYGKAKIEQNENGETLYFYGVKIMTRDTSGKLTRFWDGKIAGSGKWSATTGKHIRAFCGLNKADFLKIAMAQ